MKQFEDDMDELFNKAGRHYPLKTEPKNWDGVRKALHGEQGVSPASAEGKSLRRYLPLLMLLLLLVPAYIIFTDKRNLNVDKTVPDREAVRPATGASQHKGDNATSNEASAPGKNTATHRNDGNMPKNIPDHELSYVPPAQHRLNKAQEEESGNVKGGLSNPPQAVSYSRTSQNLTPVSDKRDWLAAWNEIPSVQTPIISMSEPSEEIPVKAPDKSFQSTGSASVPNFDKTNKHKGSFYYGIIAAPDISTIKGQEVRGIGYSLGVLGGYRITSKWSVEGGVLWSTKKYYTIGKHFSKGGARIPDYIDINWLDGGCNMLEFPIVAGYNFSTRKNSLFAAAGLTSYIMKKEEYDYSAQAGAGGIPYEGYRTYDRSGDHLFANFQVSAGYNFKISRKLNFRVEPYLKLPLKKIGIGEMPVTSTGLYLGIMRETR